MVARVLDRQIKLRGAALQLMKFRGPEVLLAGPAGTGKSYACLQKIHMLMLANPGARALIVRKTHVSLTQTGLVTFREQVLPEALSAGIVHWYGGSSEKQAGYRYANGSFVAAGGMDQAAKIMSSEYDVIYVQEATDLLLNDWEMLATRLRYGMISFQQLIGDCNPQQPSHWLKKRCDAGQTVMLYSLHQDNPGLFDADGVATTRGDAYLKVLNSLTGVRKLRLQGGVWAAAEGIVYEDWRPDIHLTDRKKLPKEWTRLWTVDFGFVHPFVWQMWAIDPDGRLWLEKEIHKTRTLVEDHARKILEIVTAVDGKTWKYPKPRAIVCDHDAEDRATLERHLAMSTVAATKTVSDGIQAVQARLKVQLDRKPRLFVCRDSLVERDEALAAAGKPLNFAQEIEGYTWAKPPAQVDKALKDEPNKVDDDSMDAGRYAVAYEDLAAKPRIRVMGGGRGARPVSGVDKFLG